MSYYIVNTAGQTEGPYPAEWIRANVTPSTLVSHRQQWVPLAQHPDFRQPVSVPGQGGPFCAGCGTPLQPGLRFCPSCGTPVSLPGTVVAPAVAARSLSPHLALLNLVFPGIAQIAFGQLNKGILWIVLFLVSLPTIIGPLIVLVASIVDGYKVGEKLRRTGAVGEWEWFPS
jgi:TM2 domain-containing membrane protein YozV